MKQQGAIKWMMKIGKKERLKMTALILSNVFFSVLSVAFAFAVKFIIDGATRGDGTLTAQEGLNKIIVGSVMIGTIVLLQFLFRVLINGLTEHIKGKLELTFRSHVFNETLKKKYEKINEWHSGELMNRLTADVGIVCEGITSIVPTLAASVARLLLAVGALIYLDWIFAVAISVAGILVFFVITLLKNKLKKLHKGVQSADGEARSYMQECLENSLAVKSFDVGERISDKAVALNTKSFKVKMKRKNYSVLGHATYNFIFSAGYIFALIYGGIKILNGDMLYGTLSAILQLVNNVQVPFASLSNVLPKYFAMTASAERLMEVEEIENEPFDSQKKSIILSNAKTFKAMQFENVSFKYEKDYVFTNACFRVEKGEFVVITGASGIGKSTVIKLLLGIYPPTDGRAVIEFEKDKAIIDSSTRNLFSFVPQGNMLFSGTIRDNITFIRNNVAEEELAKALEIACVADFIDELPNGIDTVIKEKGQGLSEGQIQRIAIARAILCKPEILLLDEATSALDKETEEKLLSNLKTLTETTVIMISHKPAALSVCDRTLIMKDKSIYACSDKSKWE